MAISLLEVNSLNGVKPKMIDNKRFLHGRRSFAKGINRDIVIVQTERANFGYGSTTRGLGKELL